jgi:hypothetical protein
MRSALLLLSLLGTVFFGGAFALSFADPLSIERAAREVIRIQVERKVGEKIDSLSGSRVAVLAQRALRNTEADIARTEKAIREDLPRKVANVVADMRNADCECRKRMVARAQKAESDRLSSLTQVRERLVDLIESAYASATGALMREFRIFTASNAIAFALLGLVTLVRGRATLQLVLPALALVGAVVVTGGLYLFNQNWLHTIVFGQYVGLGYALYLGIVALLFADILLNRARVTTRLVNLAFNTVGSAATAVPC